MVEITHKYGTVLLNVRSVLTAYRWDGDSGYNLVFNKTETLTFITREERDKFYLIIKNYVF